MKRRARRDPASRLGRYKDEAQRLYFEVFHADQRGISSGRAEEAKHALASILAETGHAKSAQALLRHRGKIYGTPLGEKIYRTLFGAPQTAPPYYKKKPEKKIWVAQIRSGEWLRVDSQVGNKTDGKPYFIGPGIGYDVNRIVVWAYDEGSAMEIAEEKWPHLMFDEVDEDDVGPLDADGYPEDQDIFPIESFRRGKDTWFKSGWARHSQDIRIFERARHVEHARVVNGYAVLKNGQVIDPR